MQVPPAHGGAGLELLDVALAAEELGWACTPGPFLGSAMATAALLASDDAEVHRRWLPGIASGEVIATVAIGEEQDEWDAAKLTTRSDGRALHGLKPLVPAGTVADVIIVAAHDEAGPGLWLVERGAPRPRGQARSRAPTCTRRVAAVKLDGTPAVKIAAGRAAIDRTRDAGLVLLAADAYGGARRCIEMTSRYALTREQFGQPIGAFQAVKHQLADIITESSPRSPSGGTPRTPGITSRIAPSATRRSPRRTSPISTIARRASAPSCTAGSASPGSTISICGSGGRSSTAPISGTAEYHRARAAALAGW